IVGYADEDTVVASCYAANGRMSATSVHGASYQDTGKDFDGVIGHAAAKQSIAVNSAGVISYNNHIKRTGASSAMFKETLGWSEKDWDFSGDLPVAQSVGGLNGEVELTVVVKDANNDNFVRTYSYTVSANRPPVHEWYRQNKLPEYESNENNTALSWGYYFDKALTQKVPYGFVPATAKTTLYVGFADYSEVAGTYYVSDATYSNGAYIELDGEGNVFFRNGGLTYRSKYTYDGNEIVLMDSALANLLYTMEEIDGNYFTVKGVKTDEGFVLSGTAILVDVENSTDDNPVSITENMTLSVVKASNTFVYGEYLAESNGSTYLFSKGGTGVFINERKVRQSFTYTVSGNEVNIVYDGGNGGATATLSPADGKLKVEKVGNLTVRLKDGFAGVWRTTANS
ncbi:MAG: hypothetical protein K2O62_02760, partial [Clostridia bacterium]|nr:hypothetical protein [Clostridia bacterium]